jgi:hypothetical protein
VPRLRFRDETPDDWQNRRRLLRDRKGACPAIARTRAPLDQLAAFEAIEDSAQRRRIQRRQLRESLLSYSLVLCQDNQRSTLRQIER